MKKLLILPLLILFVFASFSVDASAQRVAKKYNQSIGANPIGLAFGLFNATYEQQISAENSFTVNGIYWGLNGWTAFGVGGSYRWYLMQEDKKAIQGLGFGPAISFGSWSFENSTFGGGLSIAIGGEAAYKFIFDGGFVVEPSVSIMFNVASINGLNWSPFGLGCTLGYAW